MKNKKGKLAIFVALLAICSIQIVSAAWVNNIKFGLPNSYRWHGFANTQSKTSTSTKFEYKLVSKTMWTNPSYRLIKQQLKQLINKFEQLADESLEKQFIESYTNIQYWKNKNI